MEVLFITQCLNFMYVLFTKHYSIHNSLCFITRFIYIIDMLRYWYPPQSKAYYVRWLEYMKRHRENEKEFGCPIMPLIVITASTILFRFEDKSFIDLNYTNTFIVVSIILIDIFISVALKILFKDPKILFMNGCNKENIRDLDPQEVISYVINPRLVLRMCENHTIKNFSPLTDTRLLELYQIYNFKCRVRFRGSFNPINVEETIELFETYHLLRVLSMLEKKFKDSSDWIIWSLIFEVNKRFFISEYCSESHLVYPFRTDRYKYNIIKREVSRRGCHPKNSVFLPWLIPRNFY